MFQFRHFDLIWRIFVILSIAHFEMRVKNIDVDEQTQKKWFKIRNEKKAVENSFIGVCSIVRWPKLK